MKLLARRITSTKIVIGAVAMIVLVTSTLLSSSTMSAVAAGGDSWTEYHANPAGTGVASGVSAVVTSKRFWTSRPLSGQLYGEPLEFNNMVFIATENDVVYALSSSTGRVVWSRHVASSVPSTRLPCGDISPQVGITGTPAIDPTRNEIFLVADELVNGSVEHRLVGLNVTSGAVELNQDVDPPGADPTALLQRTGIALDGSNVVFAMGGNYGDCATYRGRVESVAVTGSKPKIFTVDAKSGQSQGAIWMGGAAPVINAKGDVWVSVGNGSAHSSGQAYDFSDSALELSVNMGLIQYFAPSNWADNNAQDLDMSTAPVLLSDGQVVLAGKSRIVYLLNGSHLGGIGHEETSLASGCSEDIDGASVAVGLVVFLPCLAGTQAVRVGTSPASLNLLWQSSNAGGPPIYAAGLVWSIGANGVLYGLSPSTGAIRQQAQVGTAANHFPTPSVGDGLLAVTSTDQVVAFRATAAR
jgi:outer membrane protein assembly factor BamB